LSNPPGYHSVLHCHCFRSDKLTYIKLTSVKMSMVSAKQVSVNLEVRVAQFIEEWLNEHGALNPRVAELMVDKVAVTHLFTDAEEWFDVHGESLGMEPSTTQKFGGNWFSREFFFSCWAKRLRDWGLPKVSIYPKHTYWC
jgi:hypothetical protein